MNLRSHVERKAERGDGRPHHELSIGLQRRCVDVMVQADAPGPNCEGGDETRNMESRYHDRRPRDSRQQRGIYEISFTGD